MKNHIASELIAMSLVTGLSVASGEDSDDKYMTQEEAYDKGWFSPVEATHTLDYGDVVTFEVLGENNVRVLLHRNESQSTQLLDKISVDNFSNRSATSSSLFNNSFTDLVYRVNEEDDYRRIRCETEATQSGEKKVNGKMTAIYVPETYFDFDLIFLCVSLDDSSGKGLYSYGPNTKHPDLQLLETEHNGFFFNSVSYSVAQGDQIHIEEPQSGDGTRTISHVTIDYKGEKHKKVLISAPIIKKTNNDTEDTLWGNNLTDLMLGINYSDKGYNNFFARVRCEIPTGKTLWGRYEGEFNLVHVDDREKDVYVDIYTCQRPKFQEENR